MKYNNQQVRKQTSVLPEAEALDLLQTGEYGFLAMQAVEGGGYGIPLNYVVDEDKVYVHCAKEGEKLRCIQNEPQVSFVVVGPTKVVPEIFTTLYTSIVLRGQASIGLSQKERVHALELILNKYSLPHKQAGMKVIKNAIDHTEIIRIDVDSMSGKTKR